MSEMEKPTEEPGVGPAVNQDRKKHIIKEARSLLAIVIAVLVFRSVLFEPFRIPSGSMIPTLMIGDFILVNKFSYGFKVPFSDISFSSLGIDLDPIYLFGESAPKRGDVVVFKYPEDPATNYIKRVIGLPGDTIEIRQKVVFVNGEEIKAEEIDGKAIMDDMDDKFKKYNLKFFNAKTGEAEHVIGLGKFLDAVGGINAENKLVAAGMAGSAPVQGMFIGGTRSQGRYRDSLDCIAVVRHFHEPFVPFRSGAHRRRRAVRAEFQGVANEVVQHLH